MERKIVVLGGGKNYTTEGEYDAFRVKEGVVIVYIVPLKNGQLGRRSYIYEAKKGEVIPSFVYRDIEFCEWRFCFASVNNATIEIIENGSTKLLRERFSEKVGLKNTREEGFNGALVDKYRFNINSEDSFIRNTQKQKENISNDISEIIYNAFKHKDAVFTDNRLGNPVYEAMAFLCKENRIDIAPYEKIESVCKDLITVQDIARISHFSYRNIILEDKWYKKDLGNFIAINNDGNPIICIKKGISGYRFFDLKSKTYIPLSKELIESINRTAFMIYRGLPSKRITTIDFIKFCFSNISLYDLIILFVLSIVTALIGLVEPSISEKLYNDYIPLGNKQIIFELGCLMGTFMISNVMLSIVKNLSAFRITSRMSYDAQGAIISRVFSLSESFFRKFESADLAKRIVSAGIIVNTIAANLIMMIVSAITCLVFLIKMCSFSSELTLICLVATIIYCTIYCLISMKAISYKKESIMLEGKTSSIIYQFISGIEKIRISGVENRALYEYIKPYTEVRNLEEKFNNVINFGNTLTIISSSVFSLLLYSYVVKNNYEISIGTLIAFNAAFGSYCAYVLNVCSNIVEIKKYQPEYNRLKEILVEIPEYDGAKEIPGEITGKIEINNLVFSYSKDAPNVINGISLSIKPGEYIGIVGPSGCGKSTLLKLMLGFERPNNGKIYFDNVDIDNVDKRELRKKMGVVLQDGKLIAGSIYENITITSPFADIQNVQKVIYDVGLEKDIETMPMGIHTVLSEDCGMISGGQQQRILIARALISNPQILLFDEATSALDNITQSQVCATLEKMPITRIVIAHRLSTIIKCDRIIVLNDGKIVEQGTFDELMAQNGLFYRLASRQV